MFTYNKHILLILVICYLYSRNTGYHCYFCMNIGTAFYKNISSNWSSFLRFSSCDLVCMSPYPSPFLRWNALESGGWLAPSCNGICSLSPLGHDTECGPQRQHLKAVTVASMVLLKTKATVLAFHPCGESQPGKAARIEQWAQKKPQLARVHKNGLKEAVQEKLGSFMVWWLWQPPLWAES